MYENNKILNLFYYNKKPNFGDVLNLEIISKLFNISPISASATDNGLVAIVSLLESFLFRSDEESYKSYNNKFKSTIDVWGTGFMSAPNTLVKRPQNLPEVFAREMKFHAVRGKLTFERIQNIYNDNFENIVLGDPGLLACRLIDVKTTEKIQAGHYTALSRQR